MNLKIQISCCVALLSFFIPQAGALPGGVPVYLLPMACSELMPDTDPFLRFTQSIARGNLLDEPQLSRRLFRLLALRDEYADATRNVNQRNPVDIVLQKTLCFYRQQTEPLKPVPFDDEAFVAFMKKNLDDVEKQVTAMMENEQIERLRKKEFEDKLEKNKEREDSLRSQARAEAKKQLKQIEQAAQRQFKKKS